MKRIFSILLVISLLLSLATVFASCGAVSQKDMEENPQHVLSDAMTESINVFFDDKAGIGPILKKSQKMGKYTISFADDELMGGEITKITETIYSASDKKQFVSETKVVYNGEEINASVYCNNAQLAVSSESIFGSDIALLFDPLTFIERFAESGLAELTGMDSDSLNRIIETVKIANDKGLFDAERCGKELQELCNDLIDDMNMTVGTEKIENGEGKEEEYIVSTYTISNSTVKKMANTLYDYAIDIVEEFIQTEDYDSNAIRAEFDEFLAEMDNNLDMNVSVKTYVSSKEGILYLVKMDGALTVIEHEYEYEYNEDTYEVESVLTNTKRTDFEIYAELRCTSDEITFRADIENDDNIKNVDAVLQKEVNGGNVGYKLNINVTDGAVTVKVINASYQYEDDGDITITVNIPKEVAGSDIKMVLMGDVNVDADKVTLEFDSLQVGKEIYDFKLILSVEAVDSIPEFPDDAEDIVDISKDEWEKIAEDIQNSDFGRLIGGALYY